jgi:hypothetical protein
MSSPFLTLPLELRHEIFSSLVLTPHTIIASLPSITDCQTPIEQLSRTCKQIHLEVASWSSLNSTSSFLSVPPFGLIAPSTTIKFHLTYGKAALYLSKIPKNIEEVAVFQLWRDIMVALHTSDMDDIDREIRDRFDRGENKVLSVLAGVYEDITNVVEMGEVRIYGGNKYWVLTTSFWARNLCEREGSVLGGGN